jgi:hypothetical protein
MSEIRLRAITQIDRISRELEKAERARTDLHPTDRKQTKEEQLEAAGISTTTAHRYEQLTGCEARYCFNALRITWVRIRVFRAQ